MTISGAFKCLYAATPAPAYDQYQGSVSYIDSNGSASSGTVTFAYPTSKISSFTALYPGVLTITTIENSGTTAVNAPDSYVYAIETSGGVTYEGEYNSLRIFSVSGDGSITITVRY